MSHTRGARIDPHGFDAGKLIKGKKRHVLVDTLGLLLHALVTPADVQDRDGGLMLLSTLFGQFPFLTKLFADSAYAGPCHRDCPPFGPGQRLRRSAQTMDCRTLAL